jgi:hypothetical protein
MSTEPPVATPPSAPAPVPWRFQRRGTPWFGHALAAGGGALIAIGLIAIGGDVYPEGSDDPGWVGALLSLALVVVAYVVMLRAPSLVRSACTAAIAIGVAAAIAFLVFPGVDGFDDLRGFFVVTIAAWVAAFLVGPTRGRSLFLGLALLLLFVWVEVEVTDIPVVDAFFDPFGVATEFDGGAESFDSFDEPGEDPFGEDSFGDDPFPEDPFGETPLDETPFADPTEIEDPNWGEQGAVAGMFAVVYLLAVAVLDNRGRHGIATAFVLPGIVALSYAVSALGSEADSVYVGALLSVAAGLFAGAVGARTHRRFTVWWGAFFATVGALLFAGQITDDTAGGDDGDNIATVFGLLAVVFGLVMVTLALAVRQVLGEPAAGDDEPVRPLAEL